MRSTRDLIITHSNKKQYILKAKGYCKNKVASCCQSCLNGYQIYQNNYVLGRLERYFMDFWLTFGNTTTASSRYRITVPSSHNIMLFGWHQGRLFLIYFYSNTNSPNILFHQEWIQNTHLCVSMCRLNQLASHFLGYMLPKKTQALSPPYFHLPFL